MDAIRPQVGDSVLVAKRFSAFAGTRLRRRLAELGRDQPVISRLVRADASGCC
ncbi:hypothetical protein ACRAWF_35560 [Streptomyces sp. L7]